MNCAHEWVNPIATNKARGTYDATCIFCVDEVSTLGRQFSGWFSCVVGISAEKLLTQHRFKTHLWAIKYISASHIFTAVVAAPNHFCHKHHKLIFWYVWSAVLGETWSCFHTQTEVSSGDHMNKYCKTLVFNALFYP